MGDKKRLQELYIKELEEKLRKAERSYKSAKKDTIEAEGRMVTRYDSTKTETAWLADGYLKEVKELEVCIEREKKDIEVVNVFDSIMVDKFKEGKFVERMEFVLEADSMDDELFYLLLGKAINDTIMIENSGSITEYQIRSVEKKEKKNIVAIGSYIVAVDQNGYEDRFYIVSQIGGIELKLDEEEVFCLSPQAPITRAFLGKKEGEQVLVNLSSQTKYTIAHVH